jgi:hypothetical protein
MLVVAMFATWSSAVIQADTTDERDQVTAHSSSAVSCLLQLQENECTVDYFVD